MPRIPEYVKSLPGVARRSIERVLSSSIAERVEYQSRYSDSIDTREMRSLSIVTPAKINMLLRGIEKKNSDAWLCVDEVDRYARFVAEHCNSAVTAAARSIQKSSAVLDGVITASARRETVDHLYTENFSSMDGTDRSLTDADISGGYLSLGRITMASPAGEWSIKSKYPHNTICEINRSTGSLTATAVFPPGAAPNESLRITAKYTMPSPSMITMVKLNVSGMDFKAMRILNASGQATTIEPDVRISGTDIISLTFPRTSATALEVDFEQKHFTIETPVSISDPVYSIMPISHPKVRHTFVSGSDLNRTGMNSWHGVKRATRHYNDKPTEGGNRSFWHQKREAIQNRNKSRNRNGWNSRAEKPRAKFTASVIDISCYDTYRKTKSDWVSTPITVNGDVRRLSLHVDEIDTTTSHCSWFISVEGRPWVPIIPENKREVTGEILDLDFSGIGMFDYPADESFDIHVQGIPENAEVDWIANPNEPILGLEINKTNGGFVTVDYMAAFSGIVDLDEIGQASSGVRLIDATTDGELGEHFDSVPGSVMLKNIPSGTPEVYLDGVLAIHIPQDMSFTDPSLKKDGSEVYCKVVGKTLYTGVAARNVSVYYKFSQTSIRLKAKLESSKAIDGDTPMVNSVSMNMKMVNG